MNDKNCLPFLRPQVYIHMAYPSLMSEAHKSRSVEIELNKRSICCELIVYVFLSLFLLLCLLGFLPSAPFNASFFEGWLKGCTFMLTDKIFMGHSPPRKLKAEKLNFTLSSFNLPQQFERNYWYRHYMIHILLFSKVVTIQSNENSIQWRSVCFYTLSGVTKGIKSYYLYLHCVNVYLHTVHVR